MLLEVVQSPDATVTLFVFDGEDRIQIGDPTTAEEDGTWTISVDPDDPNLGDGQGGIFTFIAEVDPGEGETEDTNMIEITIDCPPVLDRS